MTAIAEAERRIVAAVLSKPDLLDQSGLEPEDFADARMRRAFEAELKLWRDHRAAVLGGGGIIDPYMVAEVLGLADVTEDLVKLVLDSTFSRLNWEFWAERLREESTRRRRRGALVEAQDRVAKAVSVEEQDAAWTTLQREMRRTSESARGPMTLADILCDSVDDLGRRMAQKARGEAAHQGVPTGIRWLDGKLGGGVPRGYVTVVAGRTSHGKSTLAQIIAKNALSSCGVHYFGMEDGPDVFGARALAEVIGLDVGRFLAGDCDEVTFARMLERTKRLKLGGASSLRRFLFDHRRLSVDAIGVEVQRHREENNTALVVVDYLTLLKFAGDQDRRIEIGDAMTRFQELAIEQNVAYVVLAQLNRGFVQRGQGDKRPQLSDLRDSGEIEERAAVVIFIYAPGVDEEQKTSEEPSPIREVEIIVGKNKFGPRDAISVFQMDFSRYKLLGHASNRSAP